jgi:hypothetical protein
MDTERRQIQKCAEWLVFCLSIGYKKSQLDRLEALWWKYHGEPKEEV